jgi:hypothetical protein
MYVYRRSWFVTLEGWFVTDRLHVVLKGRALREREREREREKMRTRKSRVWHRCMRQYEKIPNIVSKET